MNWEQVQGKWTQLKGSVKVEWAKITDDDLERIEGERDKLVGLIQDKYGKSREEASEEVDHWCSRV